MSRPPRAFATVVSRPLVWTMLGIAGAALLVGAVARPAPATGWIADDGFDWPVGAPDAAGYHDAQPFGANTHLGEDWNGDGGGDSDLGDPVRSIARGRVSFAADVGGGWGNVVRIVHAEGGTAVESLYAHLDTVAVEVGQAVLRGQLIGTVGTAHGQYAAHLHLELRAAPGLDLGGGYGAPFGQVAPTPFIRAHRPRR